MQRPTRPLRVLIVEDEALLAMDMEAKVEDSGHSVPAEAASLQEVEALADETCFDLAFVDIQLARGTNASRLRADPTAMATRLHRLRHCQSGQDSRRLLRRAWRDREAFLAQRLDVGHAVYRARRLRSASNVAAARQLHRLAGVRRDVGMT